MTLTLSAMVRCNSCGRSEIVDEDNLHARMARNVMTRRGWRYDTEGRDFCPGPCQDHLPKRRLDL